MMNIMMSLAIYYESMLQFTKCSLYEEDHHLRSLLYYESNWNKIPFYMQSACAVFDHSTLLRWNMHNKGTCFW